MASKVLLVEDDNNLREIYQARLQAEGYDIVSAKDGEEALVIAKQEQPDLIISDVMMPRVSGFEMLDILRNTEGLKDPKVIMLTALGQADDKNRASQLGADRYLVKSQVTLEDIVKAAQDLLNGESGDAAATVAAAAIATDQPSTASSSPPVADLPVVDTPLATPPDDPVATPAPATPAPSAPVDPPPDPAVEAPIESIATPAPTTPGTGPVVTQAVEADPNEADPNDQLIADALKDLTSGASNSGANDTTTGVPVDPPAAPAPDPEPASPPPPAPVAPPQDNSGDSSPVAHKKIIKPLDTPVADVKPDINDLLAQEEAKNATDTDEGAIPVPPPIGPNQDVVHTATAPEHPPGHVIAPTSVPSVPEVETAPPVADPVAAAPEVAPAPSPPPPAPDPVPAPTAVETPVSPEEQPTSIEDVAVDPNSVAL